MPKSNHTLSPPRSSPSKLSLFNAARDDDELSPKMSETALRKKKNADAQAAFRARRANYIATLEETVTSLESVVVQLQDSCRESRNEAAELRQENTRILHAFESLKHESREREKFFKGFWQGKKGSDHDPSLEDMPPASGPFASVAPSANASSSSLASAQLTQANAGSYAGPSSLQDSLRYSTHSDPTSALGNNTYHSGAGNAYGDRSPSLTYLSHESDAINPHGRPLDPQRMPKMGHYYNMQGMARDTGWPTGGVPQATSSGADSGHQDSASSSHSPGFMESPIMTSTDMPYAPRFPMIEDQKANLPNIDSAPYMFGNNRSSSPTNSSSHTGSSTSVSSNFQFVFPPESERTDNEYRRHTTHGTGITLHGGTADVSSFALAPRRPNVGPERPMLGGTGALSTFPVSDVERTRGRAGSESAASQARRSRRHSPISPGARGSRSPSPGSQPPISSTLAVIKAQAFGALRRTRVRPKRGSEGAAKAAMEVLEARGIGLGIGTASGTGQKRQRVHDEEEMHS